MRNKTIPHKQNPRTGRRALALLLSCLMVLTMLPAAALAEDTTPIAPTVDGTNIYANGLELIIEAGTTNGNTNIRFDADGNGTIDDGEYLQIGGEGPTAAGYDLSEYSVYGSSYNTTVTGDTKITMTGGTVNYLYGGGNGPVNEVTGEAVIHITGGKVRYQVYGGGNGNNSTVGSTKVIIEGGEMSSLYGGSYTGAVTGAATVKITGGTVAGYLYCGGNGSNSTVGSVDLTIGGGAKIGEANMGVVINGTSVSNGVDSFQIDPVLIGADGSVVVYLPVDYTGDTIATGASQSDPAKIKLMGPGAAGKAAYFDSGEIKVKDAPVPTVDDKDIYANGAEIKIVAGSTPDYTNILYDKNGDGMIDDGEYLQIGEGPTAAGYDLSEYSVFGGSHNTTVTGDTKITMTGGTVDCLYGGGKSAVTGDTSVTINGGHVSWLFGGGQGAVNGDTSVTINGGTVGYAFGGGRNAAVTGSTCVVVGAGGTVNIVIHGGGNGYTSTVGTRGEATTVTVEVAGQAEAVYGGGDVGTVNGDVSVTITGTVTSNVSGGGNSGSTVNGNTEVTITGTVNGDVYGNSYDDTAAVTGTKTVTIGGGAQIGADGMFQSLGVVINSADPSAIKNGVDSFNIDPDLTGADGSVCIVLPEGYESGTIATDAAEGDLAKIALIGPGAAGKAAKFNAADHTIYIGEPFEAAYTIDGGAHWTSCGTLEKAMEAMEGADDGTQYQVRLLRDVAAAAVRTQGTFTLDLNGKQLAPDDGRFPLNVARGTDLTITDRVGGGKILGPDADPATDTAAGAALPLDSAVSLTLTGDKPFTIQGGSGAENGTGIYAAGANGVTIDGHTTFTVSGTGRIQILGGRGGSGGIGGDAVHGGYQSTLLFSNPNAMFQGGDGGDNSAGSGGRGGHGLFVGLNNAVTIHGGSFAGGRGGSGSDGTGGDGGVGVGVQGGDFSSTEDPNSFTITGGAFTGGEGGAGSSADQMGGGLVVDIGDVTISGGAFSGRYGCVLYGANTHRWSISGGVFTGIEQGLWASKTSGDTSLSVTGGAFSGGQSALWTNLTGSLAGGAFTGSGASSYAVSAVLGMTSGQLLAPGMAYIDAEGQLVTQGLGSNVLGQNATLRVAPAASTPEPVYGISGTVMEYDGVTAVPNARVTLKQGAQTLAATMTDEDGHYAFGGIPAGLYNVVAQKDGRTKTILVQLTDSDANEQDITLPKGAKNSVVEVAPGTPPVVVGGVEQVAEKQGALSGQTITVRLTVEAKTEPEGASEIIAVAGGKTLEYLDVSLVKESSSSTSITDLGKSNQQVLELVLPYDFNGKQDVTVYRRHVEESGAVTTEPLNSLPGRPDVPQDGTFWADRASGYLHIYAKKFSTYAIGYTPASAQSSGGGGGGTSSYTITAAAGTGGSISPSGRVSVTRNGDKTFTIKPDSGYTVADVLVDGRSVGAVERYTFEEVTKAHTIQAIFQKTPDKAAWNPFVDVLEGDWFYGGVKYVYEHDLMNGTAGDQFSPYLDTSRGMIVTILWRMAGSPQTGGEITFPDVAEGKYYTDAVRWASETGVIKGYDTGKYGPNDPITREQLAAILYRYAGSPAAPDLTLEFTDASEISGYARDPMRWAVSEGIITGRSGGILDPRGQATRGETAAMLERLVAAAMR